MELRDLPDAIAFLRERGMEFVIPLAAKPERHIAQLFETLGVEWTVDPVSAERMRRESEPVDQIETKWCPRCREWGIAHDRTGLCLWCDGPMQDEPDGDVGRKEPPMSTTVATSTCKRDGCTNPIIQQYGPYGRLCAKHLAEAKQAQTGGSATNNIQSGVHTASVRALVAPAKALDTAAKKLAAVPTNEKARAELAEAMRHVTASATPANLERLADATKAMSKDQPRRKKLQDAYDEALRVFKAEVSRFARELADA